MRITAQMDTRGHILIALEKDGEAVERISIDGERIQIHKPIEGVWRVISSMTPSVFFERTRGESGANQILD